MVDSDLRGGMSLITREGKIDPDEAERNERRIFRPPDRISSAIGEVIGRSPQSLLFITNPQFEIQKSGLRDQDRTFERSYPEQRILIGSFNRRIDEREGGVDDDTEKEIEDAKAFATALGYHFLPIIDGEIARDDLLRIKNPPPIAE